MKEKEITQCIVAALSGIEDTQAICADDFTEVRGPCMIVVRRRENRASKFRFARLPL